MSNIDYAIYAVHGAFWTAFGITQRVVGAGSAAPATAETAVAPNTARFSRSVLAVHFVAFGLLYMGIGSAVFGHRVPIWWTGQRIAGTLAIAVGAWMMCWSLVYFRSWRFRAKLDAGHQLATGGPYAWVRHPIYVGLNLLALGSALWIPDVLTLAGLFLMLLGSDLRGRAEERALAIAFGTPYLDYCARTRRFLPGVY
jgi:protein-S-isoprenylcysteine O-methyltransferase Ste14